MKYLGHAVVAVSVFSVATHVAAAMPLRLLCAAANGQYPRVVDVDFEQSRVNGWAAKITDTEIYWASEDPDPKSLVVYDHRINRLNGAYQTVGRGIVYAGPGPAINCAKAPPQKF